VKNINSQKYDEFNEILIEISTDFINSPLDIIPDKINYILKKMARYVNADRAYIFDLNVETTFCNNTYEWCNEGIEPQIDILQNVELGNSWIEKFVKNEVVLIKDVLGLPDGWERAILEPQGIKSLAAVPMMIDQKCIGFIGFDSVQQYKIYTDHEIKLLRVFSSILSKIDQRQKTEKELIEAKIKAEKSDKLKSAFLANISHEIRTPMNGIIGFTNLLKEQDVTNNEREEYLDIIQKSGQRMLSIMNDLINISKIESDMMEVYRTNVDINTLFNDLYNFFKREVKDKDISLIQTININKKIMFYTDEEKLFAIMSNLIKNAIKHTDNGKIEFGYKIRNDNIEFFVSDTGKGIPKENIESIFNRFVKIENVSSVDNDGAGLGLAITKAYVEMLDGEINVESEPGKGSKFFFNLPTAENLLVQENAINLN
jgi:signal transduction histidine kinase